VNTVMNLRIIQNAGKFLSGCTIGDFWRRAQFHDISYLVIPLWQSMFIIILKYLFTGLAKTSSDGQ
jgi:hypothetical protein